MRYTIHTPPDHTQYTPRPISRPAQVPHLQPHPHLHCTPTQIAHKAHKSQLDAKRRVEILELNTANGLQTLTSLVLPLLELDHSKEFLIETLGPLLPPPYNTYSFNFDNTLAYSKELLALTKGEDGKPKSLNSGFIMRFFTRINKCNKAVEAVAALHVLAGTPMPISEEAVRRGTNLVHYLVQEKDTPVLCALAKLCEMDLFPLLDLLEPLAHLEVYRAGLLSPETLTVDFDFELHASVTKVGGWLCKPKSIEQITAGSQDAVNPYRAQYAAILLL